MTITWSRIIVHITPVVTKWDQIVRQIMNSCKYFQLLNSNLVDSLKKESLDVAIVYSGNPCLNALTHLVAVPTIYFDTEGIKWDIARKEKRDLQDLPMRLWLLLGLRWMCSQLRRTVALENPKNIRSWTSTVIRSATCKKWSLSWACQLFLPLCPKDSDFSTNRLLPSLPMIILSRNG